MTEQLNPCMFCAVKLNSGLFWELCKQYDVPLSLDCQDIMFQEKNGHVREFKDNDIDRIFAFGNNTGKENPHVENDMETP